MCENLDVHKNSSFFKSIFLGKLRVEIYDHLFVGTKTNKVLKKALSVWIEESSLFW